MESIKQQIDEPVINSEKAQVDNPDIEPLEEGYFYCPVCGEKELVFSDEAFTKKISKEQYEALSEEQKFYVNKQFEYGILLCDKCRIKTKRKFYFSKGLFLIAFILLYFFLIGAIIIGIIATYMQRFSSIRDISFEHSWKCGAVRRIIS